MAKAAISARCNVCGAQLTISHIPGAAFNSGAVSINIRGHKHAGHPDSCYDSNGCPNPRGLTNKEMRAASSLN
jgi:hypothetical protein